MAANANEQQKRLWKPVRMEAADNYWILLIVAISVTIVVTRVSLELAGYPQIGGATYHIAHVLWGGLLMFVALTLPLTFANPFVPWLTALVGGIGAGLFIDEVGKFIFFPLAFPIIYSFILVCIWLTLRLRASRQHTTRTLLYHALEELKEVLDNDLDPLERAQLKSKLETVRRTTTDTEERVLAQALLSFVENRTIRLAASPTILEQTWARIRTVLTNIPPKSVLRVVLVVSFGYTALSGLIGLIAFVVLLTVEGRAAVFEALGNTVIVSGKAQYLVNNPLLAGVQTTAIIVAGLLALAAAILLLGGHDRLGLRLGTISLAISLLIVNLLSFYFNQIYALIATTGETLLLFLAMLYRWRFLDRLTTGAVPTPEPEQVAAASD